MRRTTSLLPASSAAICARCLSSLQTLRDSVSPENILAVPGAPGDCVTINQLARVNELVYGVRRLHQAPRASPGRWPARRRHLDPSRYSGPRPCDIMIIVMIVIIAGPAPLSCRVIEAPAEALGLFERCPKAESPVNRPRPGVVLRPSFPIASGVLRLLHE